MSDSAYLHHLPVLNSGSLQGYLDSVQSIPILSRKEEFDLFEQYLKQDDLDAVRKIVMSHLRYVVYIARGYMGYGLPLEDLVQQGNVGLMKSVKRFSLEHRVRLVSFAVHWVKAEIHEFILKNWKIVKVATTKAQRKLFFNLRKAKKRLGWFSHEEVGQVANDLGVKPEEVLEMERRLTVNDESYEPVDTEQEECSSCPASYLSLGEIEDPSLVAEDDELTDIQHEGLEVALAALDERSRDIVTNRWLTDSKVGLKELAEKYGISMERIRQIEARSFEKMRLFLGSV